MLRKMIIATVLVLSVACVHTSKNQTHRVARTQDAAIKEEIIKKAPIVVISDDDFSLYRKIVSGIDVEAKADFIEFVWRGKDETGSGLMQQALQSEPKVIIAIGPKSANAAKLATRNIPIVYCLVPRLENYDLYRSNLVGIRLEQPYEKQLSALKEIVPTVKRIGVVYNPLHSIASMTIAKGAAKSQGLELIPLEVSTPSQTEEALQAAKGQVQALWMISDPIALNLTSFEAMLKFSLEEKRPLFALNEGLVARGALLSFAVDYIKMGQQVGRLAHKLAFENVSPNDMDVIDPDEVNIAVNYSTAKQIEIAEVFAPNVMLHAASNQRSVLVYK